MRRLSASMPRQVCLFLLVATLPGVAWPAATSPNVDERRAVVFYTAETRGTLEPCGCTSDPLGDFARVTALVRRSAAKSTLLVDAGSLLFPAGEISPAHRPAARLRADFIASQLLKLPFGGSALGADDLALSADAVRPRRLAANLSNAPFISRSA